MTAEFQQTPLVGGHKDVIRGRLRRFPDQLIDEWLKELDHLHRRAPAVAAAADRRGQEAPGQDNGADGYITKPYSRNQLAEVIGRVLKQ